MLKKDELTNPNSCINKALPDEMVFVLLGRDKAAPAALRAWIGERLRLGLNLLMSDPQIAGAEADLQDMEQNQTYYKRLAHKVKESHDEPRLASFPSREKQQERDVMEASGKYTYQIVIIRYKEATDFIKRNIGCVNGYKACANGTWYEPGQLLFVELRPTNDPEWGAKGIYLVNLDGWNALIKDLYKEWER